MGGAEDTEKSHFIYQILFFQQVLPAEELKVELDSGDQNFTVS